MKKKYVHIVNADAAIKIQKLVRGFLTRLRIKPIIRRRTEAAIRIQKFIQKHQLRDKLKNKVLNREYYYSVII